MVLQRGYDGINTIQDTCTTSVHPGNLCDALKIFGLEEIAVLDICGVLLCAGQRLVTTTFLAINKSYA